MSMISPAFQDAVHDSQQCFRLLLKAMSEPGTIVTLDRCDGFGSMMSASAQTLLSMSDNVTPIWLSPSFLQDRAISENIKFHVSVPIVESLEQASFAAFSLQDLDSQDWCSLPFNTGNEEYPDSSTTVIIELDSLAGGAALELSGPGIESHKTAYLNGAPNALITFLMHRQDQMAFPLGIDVIFVADQQVMCLPRTTKVEVPVCTLL
ncbi:phosphonate C-P lyase system protein PhnH [Vibrio sp. 10N.261.55.A7]|uniref:phosphonate C-P lyase system protein PhnH n=1 Tax=Vibrio sp. 10N.261.55.A7 TaxID=1880851 RepID=UPI000C819BCE|nr:phosphonate C-P lyase system protein PhnH [Vibrio sp. 10N.261.55.A7]PMJ90753.1 phosphonate C-P lyase system protein PhnH [Vibrio sp. 10N.261.55.A7]